MATSSTTAYGGFSAKRLAEVGDREVERARSALASPFGDVIADTYMAAAGMVSVARWSVRVVAVMSAALATFAISASVGATVPHIAALTAAAGIVAAFIAAASAPAPPIFTEEVGDVLDHELLDFVFAEATTELPMTCWPEPLFAPWRADGRPMRRRRGWRDAAVVRARAAMLDRVGAESEATQAIFAGLAADCEQMSVGELIALSRSLA